MAPEYWTRACEELSASDEIMKRLSARYAGESLHLRGGAFQTYCRAVTGQQISVKAADAIYGRLEQLAGEVTAKRLQALEPEIFRAAGYSRAKTAALAFAADAFLRCGYEERLPEEVEKTKAFLLGLKGCGPWTVHMTLIFHCQAPDIFPVGDIGVRKAMLRLYPEESFPDLKAYEAFAERWKPWRTTATWLLWRELDPIPVAY